MTSCLFALLLVAAPAPEPKADWVLPAGAAIATPEAIVLWAPDFRSVLGVDGDGKRKWRVATGDQGGLRDLDRIGDAVLAYAGDEAILIAPATGKVLGRQPNVRLGAPGVPGCRVVERAGACGVSCPCSFLPVRCADLAPLAPRATLPIFEEWNLEGERTTHCAGAAGEPLARGGDVAVMTLAGSADAKAMVAPTELAGFDLVGKRQLWRAGDVGGLAPSAIDPWLAGATSDGKACWVASRAGELRVIDCRTGAALWSRRLQIPAGAEPQIEGADQGIVVRDGARVKRLDADGAVVWDVAVPPGEIVLGAGGDLPRGHEHRRFGRLAGARLLDYTTGAERGAISFAERATRWPRPVSFAPRGWVALADRDWSIHLTNAERAIVGRAGGFVEELVVGPSLVAVRTRDELAVRGLHDARVATYPGHLVVAIEGAAGAGRVILMRPGKGPWDASDPSTFGELRRFTLR